MNLAYSWFFLRGGVGVQNTFRHFFGLHSFGGYDFVDYHCLHKILKIYIYNHSYHGICSIGLLTSEKARLIKHSEQFHVCTTTFFLLQTTFNLYIHLPVPQVKRSCALYLFTWQLHVNRSLLKIRRRVYYTCIMSSILILIFR